MLLHDLDGDLVTGRNLSCLQHFTRAAAAKLIAHLVGLLDLFGTAFPVEERSIEVEFFLTFVENLFDSFADALEERFRRHGE